MIAVGTPSKEDGSVNLEYIDTIANTIGSYIKNKAIIINKSTVPPGTAERILSIIRAASADQKIELEMVSNPEFLQEGTAIQQCMNPDRI